VGVVPVFGDHGGLRVATHDRAYRNAFRMF